jgi:hypothetical protein
MDTLLHSSVWGPALIEGIPGYRVSLARDWLPFGIEHDSARLVAGLMRQCAIDLGALTWDVLPRWFQPADGYCWVPTRRFTRCPLIG